MKNSLAVVVCLVVQLAFAPGVMAGEIEGVVVQGNGSWCSDPR